MKKTIRFQSVFLEFVTLMVLLNGCAPASMPVLTLPATPIVPVGTEMHTPIVTYSTPTETPPLTPSPTNTIIPSKIPANWSLVFQDEFDSNSLDTAKWRVGLPWGSEAENSVESQIYLETNIKLSSGKLRLVADRTAPAYVGVVRSYDFTSGAVTSIASFKFGYFEARVKMPAGKGFWPAFWLLDGYGPEEIDVMEFLGEDPSTVYFSQHWSDSDFTTIPYSDGDFSKDYHVFAVLWLPTTLVYYVDEREQARFISHIPQSSQAIILNLAIGGIRNGVSTWSQPPDSTTPFPSEYLVDYVRIYQPTP